jgi:hypothetical protein
MIDFGIEDVHRLLDSLEEAVAELSELSGKSIQVNDIPILCGVVMEVLDWNRSALGDNKFGISSSVLNQFLQMRGEVWKSDAVKVANRIRTFLRAQDQAYKGSSPLEVPEPRPRQEVVVSDPMIRAGHWVSVRKTADIKQKIAALGSILDSIIQQTGRSNAPENEQALTQIERQQLIAILETALNVFRSPLVETGIMSAARNALVDGDSSPNRVGWESRTANLNAKLTTRSRLVHTKNANLLWVSLLYQGATAEGKSNDLSRIEVISFLVFFQPSKHPSQG